MKIGKAKFRRDKSMYAKQYDSILLNLSNPPTGGGPFQRAFYEANNLENIKCHDDPELNELMKDIFSIFRQKELEFEVNSRLSSEVCLESNSQPIGNDDNNTSIELVNNDDNNRSIEPVNNSVSSAEQATSTRVPLYRRYFLT